MAGHRLQGNDVCLSVCLSVVQGSLQQKACLELSQVTLWVTEASQTCDSAGKGTQCLITASTVQLKFIPWWGSNWPVPFSYSSCKSRC